MSGHGPCWPPPDTSLACCRGIDLDASDVADEVARWAPVAARILWALSGRRWGLCEVTVRPCGRECDGETTYYGRDNYGGSPFDPHLRDGAWVNTICDCESPCACCAVCEELLPGPVEEVLEVWVDGELVDPATYRVDDHRRLVRLSGYPCWPRCQDLGAEPDGPGAFAVTYLRGLPLDDAAMWAYSKYVCELVKACVGDRTCELPKRVQSITREGVTVSFVDPMDFLARGRTGLPSVDAWIAAVNPAGLTRPAAVYSPDRLPPRTQTSPRWGR